MKNYCFNILTFEHPKEVLTFYFTNIENDTLIRVYRKHVPNEVIKEFGEQEHYYTSFTNEIEKSIAITKNTSFNKNSSSDSFSRNILIKYYNNVIGNYFRDLGKLVKNDFVQDVEVWFPINNQNTIFTDYLKFTIKVQNATVTKDWEMLISFHGTSKIYKKSTLELAEEGIPQDAFNWVLYNNSFFKYEERPEKARRNPSQMFPVWNFELRDALNESTPTPDRSNKYVKYRTSIETLLNKYLNSDEFNKLIPLTSKEFIAVDHKSIHNVSNQTNVLKFGNDKTDIVPHMGLANHGPFALPKAEKIHLFYIFHASHQEEVNQLHSFFTKGLQGVRIPFNGLFKFAGIEYTIVPNFSVKFTNIDDPLEDIKQQMNVEGKFNPDVTYLAIYVNPFDKNNATKEQKEVYFHLKEYLLYKRIASQVIDANKIIHSQGYVYSLNNIATAILAKLQGQPWRLNRPLEKELVVGVGAFKHLDTNVQYIGSAFSFTNNGQFNYFECFRKNQTIELAGSIIQAVEDFCAYNSHISRLVIHFYKSMSKKELRPIEKGLKELNIKIPVFIVSINKTESRDIVVFDNNWEGLMPESGKFVKVGYNKYLLFNNTRYSGAKSNYYKGSDGWPFPVKLHITCTDEEEAKDMNTIRSLIDQVYQFSRMYWKSTRQQNLPVTIKYPEMVAEMFPHFKANEIPEYGKDKLWFL